MELKLRATADRNCYIIDITGDLDVFSCVDLKAKLDLFYRKQVRCLILNMENVPYLDSRGTGVIIYGHSLFKKDNRKFFLVGVKGSVYKVLELTKLIGYLNIEESVKHAVASLK